MNFKYAQKKLHTKHAGIKALLVWDLHEFFIGCRYVSAKRSYAKWMEITIKFGVVSVKIELLIGRLKMWEVVAVDFKTAKRVCYSNVFPGHILSKSKKKAMNEAQKQFDEKDAGRYQVVEAARLSKDW